MKYNKKFVDGIYSFGDLDYICYTKKIKEDNVIKKIIKKEGITPNYVKDNIITFLNAYKCRIANKRKNVIAKEICHVFSDFLENFKKFNENKQLVKVDLTDKSIAKSINDVYKNLKEIKGLGPTSVSKIMHVLYPDLFVMWDNTIKKYFEEHNVKNYLDFLIQMKKEMNELIGSYAEDQGISEEKAKKELKEKFYGGKKTLIKLLDEFNYVNITTNQKTKCSLAEKPK